MSAEATILSLVQAESAADIPERVRVIAAAARARHGNCVCAVLAYGSALRERDDSSHMVDLYLLVDCYRAAQDKRWLRVANRLLPPNVYYIEVPFADAKVRSKYAMVSLAHLERLVTADTLHPYFWARFAQPTALVWARDDATAARVHRILVRAILTLITQAWPLTTSADPSEARWVRAFRETYRTELRSEKPGRARELYRAHAHRYDAIAAALANAPIAPPAAKPAAVRRRWLARRIVGKSLSVLRLLKAAFTFEDGASYLAGKIEKHSGVPVNLSEWQRRHPILASGGLAWRLYRKGAIR
jgi:hypothetical protein